MQYREKKVCLDVCDLGLLFHSCFCLFIEQNAPHAAGKVERMNLGKGSIEVEKGWKKRSVVDLDGLGGWAAKQSRAAKDKSEPGTTASNKKT